METPDYITLALSYATDDLLKLSEFIRVIAYPIQPFIIDTFWHTLRGKQLIYVNDELIQWMGYENTEQKGRKAAFMKILPKEKLDIEYFSYSNDEYEKFVANLRDTNVSLRLYPSVDRNHGKGPTKHLLLTPKCLKTTMMKVCTHRGDAVREYYYALEELFEIYVNYQNAHHLRQIQKDKERALTLMTAAQNELAARDAIIANRDEQLLIERNKHIYMQNIITNVKHLERTEYIYVATSTQYAAYNQYKIGATDRLKPRMCTYNTGRADGDNLYFAWIHKCHCATELKKRVKSLLGRWSDNERKEMYILNYDFLIKFLEFICSNEDNEVEIINYFIDHEQADAICRPPVIPPALIEFDGIQFQIPAKAHLLLEDGCSMNTENVFAKHAPAEQPSPITEHAVEPNVAAADAAMETAITFLMSKFGLPRDAILNCIRSYLQRHDVGAEIPVARIDEGIKSALPRGKKTKYEREEWRTIFENEAKDMDLVIIARAHRK